MTDTEMTRRGFFKGIVMTGAVAAVTPLLPSPEALATPSIPENYANWTPSTDLEKIIYRTLEEFNWKNNPEMRATMTHRLNDFMEPMKLSRNIIDYMVVCDEQNNLPDMEDQEGRFAVDVYTKDYLPPIMRRLEICDNETYRLRRRRR